MNNTTKKPLKAYLVQYETEYTCINICYSYSHREARKIIIETLCNEYGTYEEVAIEDIYKLKIRRCKELDYWAEKYNWKDEEFDYFSSLSENEDYIKELKTERDADDEEELDIEEFGKYKYNDKVVALFNKYYE